MFRSAKSLLRRRSRWSPRRRLVDGWGAELLEDRALLAAFDLAAAAPLELGEVVSAEISAAAQVDLFAVNLQESGRLSLQTRSDNSAELNTRTTLLDSQGRLVIQSDGESASVSDDLIQQHLVAGEYFVTVEALGGASGGYQLQAEFVEALRPHEPLVPNLFTRYPFAPQPIFLTTGDFNEDGHLDIVTADNFANSLSIFMGLGEGSFQQPQFITVGPLPTAVASADFNGDGYADLVADRERKDIVVLLGRGDGSFAEPAQYPSGGDFPQGRAIADLNGDGWLDLAVNLAGSDAVSVLLGNGDGSFQSPRVLSVGHSPGSAPAVGDFNSDGFLDLATANTGSADISLLLGRGDGSFHPESRLAAGELPENLVAADLDGDGDLDLAVADLRSNEILILWGEGDGSFDASTTHSVGLNPRSIRSHDFNADGYADLAVSNQASSEVSIVLSRGDGTFHASVQYAVGQFPGTLLVRDVNADGRVDLLTANGISHDVSVLLGRGDGTFQDDLTDARPLLTWPQGTVGRDFNSDGHIDLATVSFVSNAVFVFLGRGDGSFQNGTRFDIGSTPHAVLSEDLNGDGHLDLITSNCSAATVSVLIGRGDGTFEDQVVYLTAGGEFVEPGDFNEDGHLDLIMGSPFVAGIGFLAGRGDGTFEDVAFFGDSERPVHGVSGDFNRDGHLDMASTNFNSPAHDISFRLGRGDGTFDDPVSLPVGERPHNVVQGDFNGDGHLDLLNANFGADSVSLLLGNGDGTFLDERRFATGQGPDFLVTRDFNLDGSLDLMVSNAGSTTVSLLLGRGNGTFEDQVFYQVSDIPTPRRGIVVQDINGDGTSDLAISQLHLDDIVVLPGLPHGGFGDPQPLAAGISPVEFTTGEFDGDAQLDIAVVNPVTNQLSVSLGNGDATLRRSTQLAVGAGPIAVTNGDFNGDGRLDLATANQGSQDVSVLLGLGTGFFGQEQRFAVGAGPIAIVTADFDQDGRADLATVNATSHDISLLLGREGGQFELQAPIATGELPQALVSADFNGDNISDLATANYRTQDITLFLGTGDGTFQNGVSIDVGAAPIDMQVGDLNGDGRPDLATANGISNDVAVSLGRGDGTFAEVRRYSAGSNPLSLTMGDFDADGNLDIATANTDSDDLTFLLGRGDGTLSAPISREVGNYPMAVLSDDFNDDGRLDLALAQQGFREISILQGLGNLQFVPGDELSDSVHATPTVEDFNGDGRQDIALVGQQGKILLRLARTETESPFDAAQGRFDAPLQVNHGYPPARDLAVVSTPSGSLLAALDARAPSISLYGHQTDGSFSLVGRFDVPAAVPEHIASGDLNGDGLVDLAVATGSSELIVFSQHTSGAFTPHHGIGVGVSPSSIELLDVDGDGRLDIVVANQSSGDLSVLLNDVSAPFGSELRFRASSGLYSLDDEASTVAVRAGATIGLFAAGDFDSDGNLDLVVTDNSNNRFSILFGNSFGGFSNPLHAASFDTGSHPTGIVADHFNNDGNLDLAVLNQGSQDLSIFLGDGQGGFLPLSAEGLHVSAGNLPTGLSTHDVNGDGQRDLLVGNAFGDLLTLFGNGDGSFQPYQRAGQNVSLEVADLDGDGENDFVLVNEALDRMSIHFSGQEQGFEQVRSDGLLAPNSVSSVDLNQDGHRDLIVANNGANNVLVYLGEGNRQFGSAQSFAAGTNPTGITVEDLNGDRILDLVVANEGSNDVNVLLGAGQGASWTLTAGPRLQAGAGPSSTRVEESTGDGIPDIWVTNSQADTVSLLPGVGGGFFNDRGRIDLPAGSNPSGFVQLPTGVGVFNQGSNDITLFSNFAGSSGTIRSGGLRPVAAVAGDFNRDGLPDAMLAHNGNGIVSLLLGTVDGLVHADSFSHPDVPRPTSLALSPDGTAVYIAGEGQESAILLTAFGVPVPGSVTLPSTPEVLLVTGPGLAGDVNILTTDDAGAERDLPVPYQGPTIALASYSPEGEEIPDESAAAEDETDPARQKERMILGIEEAIRRALAEDAIRDAEEGLAESFEIQSEPGLGALWSTLRFAGRSLAYAGLAPLVTPAAVAAIDLVFRGWTTDDLVSAVDDVRHAAGGVLDFWNALWTDRGTPSELPSSPAHGNGGPEDPPPGGLTNAFSPAETARTTLFADPTFVALCVVAVGRASASFLPEKVRR